jgi:hypothetical protein
MADKEKLPVWTIGASVGEYNFVIATNARTMAGAIVLVRGIFSGSLKNLPLIIHKDIDAVATMKGDTDVSSTSET